MIINLNTIKIPVGTAVIINKLITNDIETGHSRPIPNDFLECTIRDTGEKIKIPVREYVKFDTDGIELLKGDVDTLEFPNDFGVVASKNRIDKYGNTVYPIQAYAMVDKFLNNELTWDEMVSEGLKADNTFEPLQDYTIGVAPKKIYVETPGIDLLSWTRFYRMLGKR